MYQILTVTDIKKHPIYAPLWKFMKKAHNAQKRKTNMIAREIPYAVHPLKVLELIVNAGGGQIDNVPIVAAALLHDIIEDTVFDTPAKLIKNITPVLGKEASVQVAETVLQLTNPKGLKSLEKVIWQVQHAREMDTPAKIIKIADQIANILDTVSDVNAWNLNKKKAYINKAEKVIAACYKNIKKADKQQKKMLAGLKKMARKSLKYARFKLAFCKTLPVFTYDKIGLENL
ncbi:MAG: HD domain-containing protein [Lactobacillales bacterium]|jgi:(p)ppGpp synthase/HD superfamily hydrolase|nr:HD domain-containing protein [Lactobacillales bacterium]